MTSVSAVSSSSYLTPLQQLQKELKSEVTSGKISATDATALSSALTDIDSSLQGSSSSGSSGTQSAPGDLKSKIDDLISGEVSSGKLTSDQATELKDVFKNTFANGGPGGPPPSDSDSSSSTDSTKSSSDSTTNVADMLQQ